MKDINREIILGTLEAAAIGGEVPARHASLLDVGTADYLEYFKREIIDGLVSGGGSTCRFFEGPHGSGKTHLLALLEEIALDEGMVVVHTDLSADLKLEEWHSVTQYIMQNMRMEINGELVCSLPLILETWGRADLTRVSRMARATLSHPGYKTAMMKALQRDIISEVGWSLISAFLQGEKVTVADMKKSGMEGIKGPLSPHNAEIVLRTILEGLNLIGVPGIMLLFDENEKTLQPNHSTPSKKQLLAANLMRHLVDGCMNGMLPRTIVAFAIPPGFLETTTMHYQALGQRLAMARGDRLRGAWRWPVLSLDEVNTVDEPEQFLKQAVVKICLLVSLCQGDCLGLADKMENEGHKLLAENASGGYKRELIKGLCSLAIQHCRERSIMVNGSSSAGILEAAVCEDGV